MKFPPQPGKKFIYALLDPFTMRIRYVGQARDPNARFRSHMDTSYSGGFSKRWIRDCRILGRKPILAILDCVSDDEVDEKERQWIWYCEQARCKMTNHSRSGQNAGWYERNKFTNAEQCQCYCNVVNLASDFRGKVLYLILNDFSFNKCLRMMNERVAAQRAASPKKRPRRRKPGPSSE